MSATPLLYSQNVNELVQFLVPNYKGSDKQIDKETFKLLMKDKVQVYYNNISDWFPTYEFEGNMTISKKSFKMKVFTFKFEHTKDPIIYKDQSIWAPELNDLRQNKTNHGTYLEGKFFKNVDAMKKYCPKNAMLLELINKTDGKVLIYNNNVHNLTGVMTLRELLL